MGVNLRLTREHLEGNATLMDTIDKKTKMTQDEVCDTCTRNTEESCYAPLDGRGDYGNDPCENYQRRITDLTKLKEENAQLRRNWKEAERVCEGYVQDNKRVRKNTDEVIENMKAKLADFEVFLQQADEEAVYQKDEAVKAETQVAKLKAKLEDAECNRDKWFRQADYCQKKLDNVERNLDESNTELVITEEALAILKQDMVIADTEIATLKEKVHMIQHERDAAMMVNRKLKGKLASIKTVTIDFPRKQVEDAYALKHIATICS